ncbi:excinuclease ABC subunit C [Betaproteobacteria bacterium UKL13-2]|nr:excinuclease ABC subunit C [Betaproteobacteria bacterium UKL13-2]HCG53325.1 excinuclease ABC subunit C [Betaproteobacteria bacterium]
MFDPKPILGELPNLPGVYRMKNAAGEVIYVGKARNLKKRVSSYFVKDHASPRTKLMVLQIAGIDTTITASESEALLLENNLIKSLSPRYNVLFRDDKSYPYIMLTGKAFPQIRFYRGPHVKPHRYFGPFPSSWAVRDTISHLQKVFRLRTCDDTVFAHRSRPCLQHQIGRCTAPCVGLISQADYRRDIENAALFLDGKENDVVAEINQKMEAAAEAMEYELAARFRDQVRVLQHILSKQFVETTSERDADIIAVAESSGTWCVNLAMVRGGRHLGDKPFFPANVHAPDHASMLEAFITQHYADQSPPASIIVDGDFNTGDWQETLSGLAGRQVRVVSRPIGEARQWMLMAAKNASYAIARRLADRASQDAKIRALNDALGSDGVPPIERVECFDVSHTMGEATVASCVVFDQGAMQSSQYRIYNITGITPGDDYAAMRNALTRRYKKVAEQPEDETAPRPRPDLVLIDGGKGQLSVAEEVMTELGLGDILLIGVAKGEERKPGLETLIFGVHSARPREELHLEKDNLGFHLIQQIRDEAHRFAITGHRARRGKKRNTSRLEDVKGVGPKRRKALLQQFGGLQGVISASVEDLSKVEGISHELAEVIYNELH